MWYRRAGLVLLCVMASVMTISAATTAPPEPDQELLRRIEESLQALQQSLTDLKNRLPDETSPPLAPLTEAVRAGLENCLRANNSQVEGLIEHLHAGIDTMRSRVKWLIYINGLLVLANITGLLRSWPWPRR